MDVPLDFRPDNAVFQVELSVDTWTSKVKVRLSPWYQARATEPTVWTEPRS